MCVETVTDRNFTGQDNKPGAGSHFGTGQSGGGWGVGDVRVDLDDE